MAQAAEKSRRGKPAGATLSQEQLLHAYGEWLRLAQAETKAIQTHNWSLLSDCHRVIEDFQNEHAPNCAN